MTINSSATIRIAQFAAHAQLADLPDSVVVAARDLVGVCVASGIRSAGTPEASALHEILVQLDTATELPSTGGAVFGTHGRLSRSAAVTFNGACIARVPPRLLDSSLGLAPGPAVVSSVIAAAELGGGTGHMLLESVVVGTETGLRLARAVAKQRPSSGWSMQGVTGRVAAAVAVVKVLGGGVDEFRQAIGLGATQAAGLECSAPSAAAALLTGKVAADGFEAGLLSLTNWKGPEQPLEGGRGFFRLITGLTDASEVVAGLGDDWLLPKLALDSCATEQIRRLLDGETPTTADSLVQYLHAIESTDTQELVRLMRAEVPA